MRSEIGFLGLGHMGLGIATRLLDAGYALRVWNRTAAKAQPLAERGAIVVGRPRDVVTPGGVAISIVSDDAALDAITLGPDGMAEALGSGVHLSMSTVGPATARRLAAAHAAHGGAYVSCPVFGRPDVAAQGKVWACVSGDAGGRARVAPLLDAMSRGRSDFGDDPAVACAVKLGGNLLILAANAALADALALGAAHGADASALAALYGETLFASPIYQNYGRNIATAMRTGEPNAAGFSVALARKDATLAIGAAADAGVSLGIADAVRAGLDAAIAGSLGDADVSSLPLVRR